jgi:hypothetical protein
MGIFRRKNRRSFFDMSELAVIGTRRAIKELADGTIRCQVDIDPAHRKQFFDSFSEIDMPVALAPLNPAALSPAPVEPPKPESERLKPGPLCMLAVQWCKDRKFQLWLSDRWGDYPGGTDEQNTAIRLKCVLEIQSRRELDTNEQAANRFQTLIRLPYMKYQQTGVIE